MTSREQFVDDHYGRLYRLAYVMSGNAHDAQDLTQETFAAALRGLPEFRGESTPMTWLVGILRNLFHAHLRRRGRIPPPPVEPEGEPDLEPLRRELGALSEPLRTTLWLFYHEEMDYAAIARALDIPIGTVRSRLHQARETLRQKLEVHHEL